MSLHIIHILLLLLIFLFLFLLFFLSLINLSYHHQIISFHLSTKDKSIVLFLFNHFNQTYYFPRVIFGGYCELVSSSTECLLQSIRGVYFGIFAYKKRERAFAPPLLHQKLFSFLISISTITHTIR